MRRSAGKCSQLRLSHEYSVHGNTADSLILAQAQSNLVSSVSARTQLLLLSRCPRQGLSSPPVAGEVPQRLSASWLPALRPLPPGRRMPPARSDLLCRRDLIDPLEGCPRTTAAIAYRSEHTLHIGRRRPCTGYFQALSWVCCILQGYHSTATVFVFHLLLYLTVWHAALQIYWQRTF